jgi:hypothetical protein
MSSLAAQAGAVNLGQGFPDFGCERGLVRPSTTPCAPATTSIP